MFTLVARAIGNCEPRSLNYFKEFTHHVEIRLHEMREKNSNYTNHL